MLLKILVTIVLLSPATFCIEEVVNADAGITVRGASNTQLEPHGSTIWRMTFGLLGRAIGYNSQTAKNAQEISTVALDTTRQANNATAAITTVTTQLQESGALLEGLQNRERELATLRTRLLIVEAEKLDAQNSLQRLLSQATPAAATQTANEQRDLRIRTLEENMSRLSEQVNHIAVERSELETTLQTFKRNLAEIVDPEETDITSLLTKTVQKMESLSQQQKESAKMYSDAIRELQKQLEEKEQLRLSFSGTIEKLKADIQALRSATRRFEGNGYTALFDMVAKVNKRSSKIEIEKTEQEIIAHITYARILAPSVPFRNLMELDGQAMWIERLIRLSLFTDLLENHEENKDRFFTHTLSYLLISGSKLVRYGGSPINYDKPNLDNSLRTGGLLKAK